MEVILAEHAGFCFGVKRAVDTAYGEAEKSRQNSSAIYTFGPIIHNEEVTRDLERRGVNVINGLDELDNIPKGSRIIIRSHGVGRDVSQLPKISFAHLFINQQFP